MAPSQLTVAGLPRGVAGPDRLAAGARQHVGGLPVQRRELPDPGAGWEEAWRAVGAGGALVLRWRCEASGGGARTIRYVHATLRAALEDAVREELHRQERGQAGAGAAVPRAERHPLSVDELQAAVLGAPIGAPAPRDAVRVRAAGSAAQRGPRAEVDGRRPRGRARCGSGMGCTASVGRLQMMPTKTAAVATDDPAAGLVVEVLGEHRERQEKERRASWPRSGRTRTSCSRRRSARRSIRETAPGSCRTRAKARGCGMSGCTTSVTAACRCCSELGVPPRTVMEIAGHSTLEMTMNVYAHVTSGRQARRPWIGSSELVRGGARWADVAVNYCCQAASGSLTVAPAQACPWKHKTAGQRVSACGSWLARL